MTVFGSMLSIPNAIFHDVVFTPSPTSYRLKPSYSKCLSWECISYPNVCVFQTWCHFPWCCIRPNPREVVEQEGLRTPSHSNLLSDIIQSFQSSARFEIWYHLLSNLLSDTIQSFHNLNSCNLFSDFRYNLITSQPQYAKQSFTFCSFW